MKPKILTILGSPHKDGHSAGLLRRFTDGFDAEIIRYDAYDCAFAPCTDCRYCRTAEGCALGDMDAFFEDFERADGIIIASPVYNLSFPAPLKAMIDRMQRYYSARFFLGKRPPIPRHRPVALLLSAGSPGEDGSVILRQLQQTFSVTNCEIVARILQNGTDSLSADRFPEEAVRREASIFASSISLFT